MNIAPITYVRGLVRRVTTRTVAPVPERPEQRDPETGRVTVAALPAREGYDVVDVVVDTNPGGLMLVSIRPEAFTQGLGGALPEVGESIDWPTRSWVKWDGPPTRRYSTVGYSLAGDVLAESRDSGKRVALASTGS